MKYFVFIQYVIKVFILSIKETYISSYDKFTHFTMNLIWCQLGLSHAAQRAKIITKIIKHILYTGLIRHNGYVSLLSL